MLVGYGASLSLWDNTGKMPLHYAVALKLSDGIISFLVEAGAPLEACSTYEAGSKNLVAYAKNNYSMNLTHTRRSLYFKSKLSLSKNYKEAFYVQFRNLLEVERARARSRNKQFLLVIGEDHGVYSSEQLIKIILKITHANGIRHYYHEQPFNSNNFTEGKGWKNMEHRATQKYGMIAHPVDSYRLREFWQGKTYFQVNQLSPTSRKTVFPPDYPREVLTERNIGMANELLKCGQEGFFLVGACHLKGLLSGEKESINQDLFHLLAISLFRFSVHSEEYLSYIDPTLAEYALDEQKVIQALPPKGEPPFQCFSSAPIAQTPSPLTPQFLKISCSTQPLSFEELQTRFSKLSLK